MKVFKLSLSVFAVLAILAGARSFGSQVVASDKLAKIEKAVESEVTATDTPKRRSRPFRMIRETR